MYKSVPNTTYPDPVQSNWVGPFQVTYRYNAMDKLAGITGSICYDDQNQALYHYTYEGRNSTVTPNSQRSPADMYFIFSRDNGLTWSDPIILTNLQSFWTINSLKLDKASGNLNFSFYNQLNLDTSGSNYYNTQRYALTIPATQLKGYISSTPIVNNRYTVPPSTTPPIGGGLGVYGQIVIPQT
jgi:hypothetical protein